MQNCTFKPQTNSVFNQAISKSSSIMHFKRPGSAHPVAQSKKTGHDSRSVLSGRGISQTNTQSKGHPPMNRKAYRPPATGHQSLMQTNAATTTFGTNLMHKLLDQGEKRRMNKDLPLYSHTMHQRPASSQTRIQPQQHSTMQNQGSTAN